MTQEELNIFLDKNLGKRIGDRWIIPMGKDYPSFSVDLLKFINNHVKDVIGEDETPEDYEPKAITETELPLAHHAVQFHAKNRLRAEQRKRAEIEEIK